MKKFVSMLLALVMVFALCACGSKTEDGDKAESIKVGFICLHDEREQHRNELFHSQLSLKSSNFVFICIACAKKI